MVNLILSPPWFQWIDITLESFCMIIAFIICVYSYRIYRIMKEKRFLYFSLAYFFITGAFFTRIFAYLLIYLTAPSEPANLQNIAKTLIQSSVINSLGFLIHITLMLAALIVLITLNLKVQDKKLVILLFILSFISAFLGVYVHHIWFYIVTCILLIFTTHYFYANYKAKKTSMTRLVYYSFLLFTIAQALFIVASTYVISYAFAEIVQLLSFILLLITFVRIQLRPIT